MPPLIICAPYYVVASSSSSTSAYSDEVLADSPLLYYRFDETSGTTVTDSSGNSNDGTYYNSVTLNEPSLLASDNVSKAISLTAGTDYIGFPTGLVTGQTSWTIELWANAPNKASGEGFSVFMGTNTGSAAAFIDFKNNNITFGGYSNDLGYAYTYNNTTVHVVYTYDGTTRRGYINGVQVASDTPTLTLGSAYGIIGYHPYYGPGSASGDYVGTLDEVAIYNTALSATRIQAHYNAGIDVSSQTTLLIHSNTTNGSTTYTDSSFSNHVLTANGSAQHSTAQSKFGSSAMSFNGVNGTYVSAPDHADWDLGSAWTIDGWIYPNSIHSTKYAKFLSTRVGASGSGWEIFFTNSTGVFGMQDFNAGGAGYIESGASFSTSTWQHFAITYDGTNIRFFIDGTLQHTAAASATFASAGVLTIGDSDDYDEPLDGYLDEIRFVKGTAVWTTNFTPPTSAYTDPSPTELYTLLIHSDTVNGASGFVDSSLGANAVIANGNAQHSTAASKFGSSSILFDGTDDYLSMPISSAFNFNANPFTIDCWFNLNSTANNQAIFAGNSDFRFGIIYSYGGTSKLGMWLSSNGSTWNVANATAGTNTTWSTGTWYHLALTWDGSTYRVFLNGTLDMSVSSATGLYSSSGMYIGTWGNGLNDFNGYIDEFRVVNGTAVWTSNFTPPTVSYTDPDLSGNYQLLIHSDTTNGDTSIIDSAASHTITAVNGAAHSTTTSEFGATSIEIIKASSQEFHTATSADFNLGAGLYTFDFWINWKTVGANERVFVSESASGHYGVYLNGSLKLELGHFGSGAVTGTTTMTTGAWHHIAVTYDGSKTRLFFDGSEEISTSGNYFPNANALIRFGYSSTYGGYGNWYMDEIRYIKGNCIWASDFTPPTAIY